MKIVVDDNNITKISRYLALDEEELYALIPPHLSEYERTVFAPIGQENAGKKYFEGKIEELREAVCVEFRWSEKRSDTKFNDTVNLVATIADAISGVVIGIPPFIIATLLVKRGLDKLCDCE